jgi:KaiC/GvpD/RAD55 family RecA-like ATPase
MNRVSTGHIGLDETPSFPDNKKIEVRGCSGFDKNTFSL